MRLIGSDPDIETIVARIQANDLNLQPDFQRGEVWTRAKKQKLIDSVLREWHVPPIHVIELPQTRRQEVLDGQQRLVAIRDFAHNQFPVDGDIEPISNEIRALSGMLYRDLPPDVRRQFNQFTIRVFRIVDYETSEPAELFYRLNQPTNLTSAEQRNAFFGPVREQIKELVLYLDKLGLNREFLGFSNSRMAYDDVLCRVALAAERQSIAEKISSGDLIELYRENQRLSDSTVQLIRHALELMALASKANTYRPKFNKATIFTWLIFLIRLIKLFGIERDGVWLSMFLHNFEETRIGAKRSQLEGKQQKLSNIADTEFLFSMYDDRSTSRVADTSSVILRDVVVWMSFSDFAAAAGLYRSVEIPPLQLRKAIEAGFAPTEADSLARSALAQGWGSLA